MHPTFFKAKARFVANVDFPTPPFALEIAIVNLVPRIGFLVNFLGSSLLFIAALSSGFLSVIKVSLLVFYNKDTIYFGISDDFKGQSPWGAPPGGGGNGNGSGRGPTPPNVDELIRDLQDKIKRFLPGGKTSGGKSISLILLVLVFVWLASGLYRVLPDEQGVVLRFGKFVKTTQPGLNYHIPFPVETVQTPKVTKVNRMDIGFRSERDSGFSTGGGVADVPQESLMLTGDENIVNIDFSVFWVIKDAGNFLFKIQDPEGTVKAAAETAMREVIAKSDIQPILTEGRSKIELETQEIIQTILDDYESGIQITQVQTQKADPPDQVIDAFRDVQAARADMERSKNEAEAYANDVIPRARGEAQKILQAAEAYKKEVVAKAEGEASRFIAIYNEYKNAKAVTQEGMDLETMEKVLADIDKVIIEKNAGSGVVPYLPLPELKKKATN